MTHPKQKRQAEDYRSLLRDCRWVILEGLWEEVTLRLSHE